MVIKIEDLLETLEIAHKQGYEPQIIINGEYYDIDWLKESEG